jgi:CDP-4-dehydro-6-deoxyglucose reductase
MPRLLSLSRAAKLVGISRGAMQKKIVDHELESFEGQVSLDDIERVFPDVQLDDNHIIEDMERIIEHALKRARGEKLATLLAPDTHTLAARLHAINNDYARAKNQIKAYNKIFTELQQHISELAANSDKPYLFTDLNNWIDDSIHKIQLPEASTSSLLAKDTILRVMAAQVHIKNTGHEYFVDGNNSILEAGLSAGLALNYGCSNGNCGKCKARLLSGEISKTRPHDYVFSESEKLQNYFLCCSYTAVTDIEIEADEADSEKDIPQQAISAKVKKAEQITDNVLILNLKTPRTNRLRFLAGQNVELKRGDFPAMIIPIASCPCDDMNIQFHISRQDENPFIHYLYHELNTSDSIEINGPSGSFILDEDSNDPILFIAFDTGFAPIKSLIEHAITLEHAESIHLYWLHSAEKPYMHNQCRAWEDALDNFSYQHQQCDVSADNQVKNKLDLLLQHYKELSKMNIFICGSEDMVKITEQFMLDHNIDGKRLKSQIILD